MVRIINRLVKDINSLTSHLHEKGFLLAREQTPNELKQIPGITAALKTLCVKNISTEVFSSGLGISVLRDSSTRTRFSYAFALDLLGLVQQDLDEGKSQTAHGETVHEVASMISFYTGVIGIHDDVCLGTNDTYVHEVGAALDDDYKQGVLPQRLVSVNLQYDINHPTQFMADLAWLHEYSDSLEDLRNRKVTMTWTYSPNYGKPFSIPQGIIGPMAHFGIDVTLAHPESYNPISDVVEVAKNNAKASGDSFRQATSMEETFKNADIVCPKSQAPYKVMGEHTELLRANDREGLETLERQCLAQNIQHKDWHCTEKVVELIRDDEALCIHCLPAGINSVSRKEDEMTEGVFEKYRVATYKETSWKPYIIAMMILSRKYTKPDALLKQLLKETQERVK